MAIPRSTAKLRKPLAHPGRVLAMEYLEPLELTPYALAKQMDVPRSNIERLVRGEQAMTANTALRLAKVFPNTTGDFWMRLQAAHDLSRSEIEQRKELDAIEALTQA